MGVVAPGEKKIEDKMRNTLTTFSYLQCTLCIYRYASLNDGDIRSEKYVRRFRRCANMYLHKPRQYSIAYYTPCLYGITYCS